MAPRRGWVTPVLIVVAILQIGYLLFGGGSRTVSNVSAYIPRPNFMYGKTSKEGQLSRHPIEVYMEDAQKKFDGMMKRQSKTLPIAVKEYERRYGMSPPKGFDLWWNFAKENDVQIMDEYDSMMEDLKPFREMSGKELRSRALQVGQLPSIHLVRIEGGKSRILKIADFKDSEANARARGFEVMIEKFISKLPDMDIPVNAKAEGRILVPWEHKLYPNLTEQDSSKGVDAMLGGKFVPDWQGDSNVWEAYRRTCPPDSQARRLFSLIRPRLTTGQLPVNLLKDLPLNSSRVENDAESDFEFVPTVDDDFDFCSNPWARYKQGHFFSDWRTIPVYYPIFSPAKAKGYGDILIPSHYYYSSTQRYTYGWDPKAMKVNDVAVGETPWEDKTDVIFWRGATTGGGSSPPGFVGEYQRHRFLRMTSDDSNAPRAVTFAWPPSSKTNFVTVNVPIGDLNEDMMDAAFTKAVGCAQYPGGGCDAMQHDHRFSAAVPLGEHWRHKYLIDFDGMGYSARVFAFFASDSAVVKNTVYKEFFSDWIQPWLHYIPLSMSYKEIYNIHAYFSGPSPSMVKALIQEGKDEVSGMGGEMQKKFVEEDYAKRPGDEALHHIAMESKKWKRSIARKVDMEAYVYRLCLEYARLWADDREASTYWG